MTDRMLRAIENPHVDILGHPTGRMLLQARSPIRSTSRRSIDAAGRARRGARDQLPGRTGWI